MGRSDAPVIQRWALDADGVLQMTGEVNLSGLGITSTMGGNRKVLQFISETRAYYFDNEGFRVVVFDPSEMTITEDFSIGEIRSTDVAATSMNFIVREGDRFFVSARTRDADDEPVRELDVAIVSATSSAVEYARDDRCADIAFVAKDSAGGVYSSKHHALPIFADAEWKGASRSAQWTNPPDGPRCGRLRRRGRLHLDRCGARRPSQSEFASPCPSRFPLNLRRLNLRRLNLRRSKSHLRLQIPPPENDEDDDA